MSKVLRRRVLCLRLVKSLTLRKGSFTVQDVVEETGLPRSTVQDWIRRLVDEGIVTVVERSVGRKPARYAYVEREVFPYQVCKRIFTSVDLNSNLAEIYHECSSEGAVAFCAFKHSKAGGAILEARCEGTFLRELAVLGEQREVASGVSMAVERVEVREGRVFQTVRAIGGPAHALTKTMMYARGVRELRVEPLEGYVRGVIVTDCLEHLTIGIDDTDNAESGATWALALSLLKSVEGLAESISHKVVVLNPDVRFKTAGNSASFIEVAVPPDRVGALVNRIVSVVEKETYSDNTAIAVLRGLTVPDELKHFARRVRQKEVTVKEAEDVARKVGASVYEVTGRRGIVGAVASLAFFRSPPEVLMNPSANPL